MIITTFQSGLLTLFLTPLTLCVLILYIGRSQFKVDSERQFFLGNFSWQFYLLSEFWPEICWEEIAEEILFVFVWCSVIWVIWVQADSAPFQNFSFGTYIHISIYQAYWQNFVAFFNILFDKFLVFIWWFKKFLNFCNWT